MKAHVIAIDGKKAGEVDLPNAFGEPVREDLIRRAVLHELSKTRQPKGTHPLAGLQTTADYKGRKEDYRSLKNKGISRLPRLKLPKGKFGEVRIVPFARGGRRAHPPHTEKVLIEKMNSREYKKAVDSAVAATASPEAVNARGYDLGGIALPIIIEKKAEKFAKTRDVIGMLGKLKLGGEVDKAKARKKKRTGSERARRGGYNVPKRILLVAAEGSPVLKAAGNIAGLDATSPKKLKVNLLAPGGLPGRLTLWTEGAIDEMKIAK